MRRACVPLAWPFNGMLVFLGHGASAALQKVFLGQAEVFKKVVEGNHDWVSRFKFVTGKFWHVGRQKSFTYVLNEKNNFGKRLAGTWHLTFGDAYGVEPVKRHLDGNTSYTVTMELSPKPEAWDGSAAVEVKAPKKGQKVTSHRTQVEWTQKEPEDGFYAYKLACSLEGEKGPFTEICEDYHYAFRGPYKWTTVPLGVNSDQAVIRLIAMDLHGHSVTNYSKEFTIDTRKAEDPLKQPLRSLPRSRRR